MAGTSLARQLKKLQAPQTSILKDVRSRDSFLFDPKEAATLDTETAFAIGTTGLEELIAINEKFSEFEQNLFAEASKFLERAVKTKEENQELDEIIKQFLLLLSPYFLLKPSHKAIEWLVYRYRIHMYNVDAFVGCILPFHETRYFARAVQLLDLNDGTSKWHWLQPLQKPGIPLPKTTLLNHCWKDMGFLKFVCNLLVSQVETHEGSSTALRPVMGFYVSSVVGALEFVDKVNNKMIATLLPHILKGLNSKMLDYTAATYMILSQLARRAVLEKEFLKEVIVRLVKTLKPDYYNGGLLCLLVVASYQKVTALPKRAFQSLVTQHEAIVTSLEELSAQHSILPLLQLLVPPLIRSALTVDADTVKGDRKPEALLFRDLVPLAHATSDGIRFVIECFFENYIDLYENHLECESPVSTADLVEVSVELLRSLWQRAPEHVDASLEKCMSSKDSDAKQAVLQLTQLDMLGAEHVPLAESGEALFLALNSPSKRTRVEAVEALVKMILRGEDLKDDFVKESLYKRLHDEDADVVEAVFSLGEELCKYIEPEVILTMLRNTTSKRSEAKKGMNLRYAILSFLCNSIHEMLPSHEVLMLVLSHLLPTSARSCLLTKCVLSSKAAESLTVLTHLLSAPNLNRATQLLNDGRFEDFINLALVGMATAAAAMQDTKQLVSQFTAVALSSGPGEAPQLKCITAYLLVELLSNVRDREVFMQVLEFYSHVLKKDCDGKAAKTSDGVQDLVISIREGKVPEHLIVEGMKKLIANVQPLLRLEEHIGWSRKIVEKHKPDMELLTCIFGTLADESSCKGERREPYQELLQNFLEVQLTSLKQKLHFLLALHATDGTTLDKSSARTHRLHSQGLAVASQLLQLSKGAKLNWLLAEQSTVFLSMLLSILSPAEEIRKLAMSAIQNAVSASTSTNTGFAMLAAAVLKNSVELITDCDLLPDVISKWHRSLRKPSGLLTLLADSNMPVYIQVGLLRMYSRVFSKDMLDVAVLLLNKLLDQNGDRELDSLAVEVAQQCLSKFASEGSVPSLSAVDGAAELLERALRSPCKCSGHDSIAVMALRRVDKELVERLPSERRTSLLETLVELALTSTDPEHKAVMRALRKVCSLGALVAEQLQKPESKGTAKTVKEAKRRRLTSTAESDPLDSPYWRRVLVVLEVLQGKKSVDGIDLLVAPLYSLLKRSFELSNSPGVEYLRQSVLSCLHGHQLAAPKHEVALLVKCLRLAHSPHTQQLVLSLLNLSAAQCPEEVLHNVTSVFTFMGASLLRQDDNYSFQVVVQTVETVVPALLQACHKEPSKGETSDDAVAQVTRVFVDAYDDIPEHRCLPLFVKLASTLGPVEFLWIVLAQMVEHSTCKVIPDAHDQLSSVSSAILDFGLSLCSSFPVAVQMSTCIKLLGYVSSLPPVKEESKKSPSHVHVFNIEQRSEKQLQWFRLTAVSMVSNLLGSTNFLGQVAELQHVGDASIEPLYQECMSISLQLVQQVTRWTHSRAPAPCTKIWKTVLAKLHDIAQRVNGLLPSAQFVAVVKALMKHELPSLRRNAMDMLNAKLSAKDYFTSDDNESLLSLVKCLRRTSLGKLKFSEEVTLTLSQEEVSLNRQTALLSLKLLMRSLASQYPVQFAKVYKMLVKLMTVEGIHPLLLSSALLCFAEACHTMPVQTIPHLSSLMPPFLEVLQDKNRPEMVTLGIVTALHRIIESLSPFLSLYLAVIIKEVCLLCAMHCTESGSQPTAIHQRLSTVCKQIGQTIEVRVLMPTIEDAFRSLPDVACVQHLMVILNSMTATAKDAELQGHFQQLQNLVLLLLNYRHEHKNLPSEALFSAEAHIVSTVTSLCFKLSEETFRPFFCKIYSWATVSEDKSERDKVFTFYHLTARLAEALKGLFVLFAGQFIRHSANILDLNHDRKRESPYFEDDAMCCHLLRHVLNTLSSCFQHKGKTFLVKERTTLLIEPLIDQIDNMLGDTEEVHSRIADCVVPCLSYFAAGCDDVARKEYHHKLLIKMRNSSAKVRYAALHVFRDTVRKLGDEYLVLLPEAVPFLAELMEDDSTEVEQLCQEVILEVEQILGEPLMKYF